MTRDPSFRLSSKGRIPLPNHNIRSASPSDCSDLVILADTATRGLSSFLWQQRASPGQSVFEVGRNAILNNGDEATHLSNWKVAKISDRIAGGLNSYELKSDAGSVQAGEVGLVLEPVQSLKNLAAGTYYLSVVSVFEAFRGNSIGRSLLEYGERLAAQQGCTRLSLLVGSFNGAAKKLYEEVGYQDWERREFVPFLGSDPAGEWVLMGKDL